MSTEQSYGRPNRRRTVLFRGPAVCLALLAVGGCRDRQLAGQKIEPVDVRTVTAYGVTLGPDASPKRVAYVLLRALRDDVRAVRGDDRQASRQARATQRSVAAPARIQANLSRLLDRQTLRVDMDASEAVYKESQFWAPVAAHYVDSLDISLEEAEDRMYVLKDTAQDVQHVLLDVANPAHQNQATLRISLAQEGGYWRVYRVGFNEVSVERLVARRAGSSAGGRPSPSSAATSPARPD